MIGVVKELQGFGLTGFVLVIITSAGQRAAIENLAALAGGKQHSIQSKGQEIGDKLFFLSHLLVVPLDGVATGTFHLTGVEHILVGAHLAQLAHHALAAHVVVLGELV